MRGNIKILLNPSFARGKHLNDIERLILQGTLANQTYEKISEGEGLFEGATGTLTSSEVYQAGNLLVDPTSAIRGTVRVSGTIQVPFTQKVPEPTNTAALIGMGMIGVGFGVRRLRHKAA